MNDNRPVSLLPIASKICERIALNQLNEYLNHRKCLTEYQNGNKTLHSTETLNTLLTEDFRSYGSETCDSFGFV